MSKLKRYMASLVFLICNTGIFFQSAHGVSQFNVIIWQNMSLSGDSGSSSGYSNNTFIAVIGNCLEIKDDICLSKVETRRTKESDWIELKPQAMTFEEILCRGCTGQTFGIWNRDERGLPTGSVPSRWSGDDISIVVQPQLYGKFWQGNEIYKPSWSAPDTKFLINGLGISINSSKLAGMTERDFRLTLDLKDREASVTGFFDGRLRDTDLQITADKKFVVQGKPVIVSAARTKLWASAEIPNEVINFFSEIYVEGTWIGIPKPSEWKTGSSNPGGFSFGNYMNSDIPKFEFFEKYFDPSRTQDVASWSISNSNWNSFRGVDPCFKNGETSGVATTNANMYTSGLPTWDKSNETLDFRMASPHLMASGKQTVGNYDLVLSESVAKCIWGIREVPTSAILNITYPDGVSEAATVTLTPRNGFVNFHANGFHFSAPMIKIKLDSPKLTPLVVPSPTPTETKSVESVTSASTKPITIKCQKGSKLIKKTAILPKCPSGYRLIR